MNFVWTFYFNAKCILKYVRQDMNVNFKAGYILPQDEIYRQMINFKFGCMRHEGF